MRKKLDLTQEDLTRQVQGLTDGKLRRPNLSKIESGTYGEPGIWVVTALAKALGTSPNYLMGFTDDPTPDDDVDAIIRHLEEQDRELVRRLAALFDAMTLEQKIALVSFAEQFIANPASSSRKTAR